MVCWDLTHVAVKWHVVVIQIKFVGTDVTILFMKHLVQGRRVVNFIYYKRIDSGIKMLNKLNISVLNRLTFQLKLSKSIFSKVDFQKSIFL
jgi:hypothetical protein